MAPNLKGLLAGWRICVTDAKRQSDIIDENVPAGQNSFDIHIPYANISTPEKANNESQKCPVFLYRLGAVWSGEVGNETSRTIWTENKELNYTSCELNTSIGDYSIANDYKAGKSIFSLQVLIILCVSGGVLLLSVVAVAVHYARYYMFRNYTSESDLTGLWQLSIGKRVPGTLKTDTISRINVLGYFWQACH